MQKTQRQSGLQIDQSRGGSDGDGSRRGGDKDRRVKDNVPAGSATQAQGVQNIQGG